MSVPILYHPTIPSSSSQSLSRTLSVNNAFSNSFFVSNDDSTDNGSYSIEEDDVYPNNFLSTDLIFSIDYVEPSETMEIEKKEYHPKKEKAKKGSKPFVLRKGDWKCLNCLNINFGFRRSCNRCNMPKEICN